MFTLDDLPCLLPELSMVSVHGESRGGGERVAQNIQEIYNSQSKIVKLVKYKEARSWKTKFNISTVFLTSGLRDYFNLLYFILKGIRTVIYIQVPYHKVASLKNPIHLIATWIFLITIFALKIELFVNSKNAVPKVLQKRSTVVLPISQRIKVNRVKNRYKPSDNFVLVTACRLNIEVGRGSRDLKSLIRLLEECQALSNNSSIKYSVLHFGDVHPSVAHKFVDYSDVIEFCGFQEDWYETVCDVFFFFSNYEGFGLAAYEASKTGTLTVINEAFPEELTLVADNIKRINTQGETSIIKEIKNAHTLCH